MTGSHGSGSTSTILARSLRQCAAAVAALIAFTAAASLHAANYAVLVGVNYSPVGEKWAADATNVRNALLATPDWAAGNIVTISGNADTVVSKPAVLAALTGMIANVGANDAFLFYYSGHGSYVQEIADMELLTADNPCDETLHLTDNDMAGDPVTPGAAGRITDDELFQSLNLLNANARKLAFLDSCFSGGFWNGQDTGDLERLNKASLIAASGENFTAPGSSAITNNWIADIGANKFDLMNLNGVALQATFNRINAVGGIAPQQKSPPGFPVPSSQYPAPYNPVDNPRSVNNLGGRFFTKEVPEPTTLIGMLPLALALAAMRRRTG